MYVSKLRLNLVFVGKLDKDGYRDSFGKQCWKLTKGLLMATKGKFVNSVAFGQRWDPYSGEK